MTRLDDVGPPAGAMGSSVPTPERGDGTAVRLAVADDRPAIERLVAGNWGGRDHLDRTLDEWIADDAALLVATLDGAIVGTVRAANPSIGAWWLEGLRVDPGRRRRGVARRLWGAVIDRSNAVQHALGRPGMLHVFSDVDNHALWQLAEGSGCADLGRFIRLIAPALDRTSGDRLVPLEADAISDVMDWLRRSEHFARVHSLAMGRPVAGRVIDEARLRELVRTGRVRRSSTGVAGGLVIHDPPGVTARGSLTISYLDAAPHRLTQVALATRHLAAEVGAGEVTVLTIVAPTRCAALEGAGFGPLPGRRGRGVLFGRPVGPRMER